MDPEEFLTMQVQRCSMIGLNLEQTGDEHYPYVVKNGKDEVVSRPLRSAQDVSEWLDGQEAEEQEWRDKFEG